MEVKPSRPVSLSWKKQGEINSMQPLVLEMRNPDIQRGNDLSKGTLDLWDSTARSKNLGLCHCVMLLSHHMVEICF